MFQRLEVGQELGALQLLSQCPDDATKKVVELVYKGTKSRAVLILGETGVGKEIVAQAILEASDRRNKDLTVVDCPNQNPHLMASELFGHERGAFTGAYADHQGLLEKANGGLVFFDEIGDLPPELQPKLLRAVERKGFCRVGGTKLISSDFGIVAATNRDLSKSVKEGTFRADLYHRLNVFPIVVPPLRDRKEDIGHLATQFVAKFSGDSKELTPLACQILKEYRWPGNVRELQNVVERAVLLSGDSTILPEHIVLEQRPQNVEKKPTIEGVIEQFMALTEHLSFTDALNLVRRAKLHELFAQCKGSIGTIALKTGVSRPTVLKWLEELGIKSKE